MNKKLTQNEAEKEFLEYGYNLLGIYKSVNDPVECNDNYGFKFYIRLGNIKCGKKASKYNNHNPFTIQNIKQYMKLNNISCEILSTEFKSAKDKLKWKCNCGNIFYKSWNDISNYGKFYCQNCGLNKGHKKRMKTQLEFCNEISLINSNLEIISKYTGICNKIKCRCKIHKIEFSGIATNVIRNKVTCPLCKLDKTSKSNEDFCLELHEINPNIQPLEKYHGFKNKIKCKCLIHNYIWYASPDKILTRRTGCPKCVSTNGENLLDSILEKWTFKPERQKRFKDCKDKNTLPFDRYLPDFNVLIEYDGEDHYKPVQRHNITYEKAYDNFLDRTRKDNIKNKYCKDNNISLVRIPYWEIDNMEYFLFDELVKFGVIEEIKLA